MALIKCPECSNEVSDKATACPRCGFPLRAAPGGTSGAELRGLLAQGHKIEAIKRYRELNPAMGLAEAKEAIEALERGGATSARGASADPGPPQESKGLSAGALLAVSVVLITTLILLWWMCFGGRR